MKRSFFLIFLFANRSGRPCFNVSSDSRLVYYSGRIIPRARYLTRPRVCAYIIYLLYTMRAHCSPVFFAGSPLVRSISFQHGRQIEKLKNRGCGGRKWGGANARLAPHSTVRVFFYHVFRLPIMRLFFYLSGQKMLDIVKR